MEKVKIGMGEFCVERASGSLYIKDKTGESRPVQYEVVGYHGDYSEREPLGLRMLMDLTGMSIHTAYKFLEDSNAIIRGPKFEVSFYTEEDKDCFISKCRALSL